MQWNGNNLGRLPCSLLYPLFTPGPNNIMLMTSGANVGFTRTIPHMLGITLGFAFMLILVGLGLMGIFSAYPMMHTILKYLSLSYLVYLAVKIAISGRSKEVDDFKPMSFLGAASFQWVNPKGWSMALTAVTLFSQGGAWLELAIIACMFTLANLPSVSFWTIAGKQLQHWLVTPSRVVGFNVTMAGLLLLSAIPMI